MANINPGFYNRGIKYKEIETKYIPINCKKCFWKIGYLKSNWFFAEDMLCEKCYKIQQVKK